MKYESLRWNILAWDAEDRLAEESDKPPRLSSVQYPSERFDGLAGLPFPIRLSFRFGGVIREKARNKPHTASSKFHR